LQDSALTRHLETIVTVVKEGPQDGKNGKTFEVSKVILVVVRKVLRAILSVIGGAHLNESPALPELLRLPENVMVSGVIDQRVLGVVVDAKPTAT
jgi:hypothetical protein